MSPEEVLLVQARAHLALSASSILVASKSLGLEAFMSIDDLDLSFRFRNSRVTARWAEGKFSLEVDVDESTQSPTGAELTREDEEEFQELDRALKARVSK